MVTANGAEDKVTSGRMSILYALIWFIIVKLSKEIVSATYWIVDCKDGTVLWILQIDGNNCVADNDLSWAVSIVAKIISWMNSFVWIAVIIIIIYAGVQVLFSNWDEEKLSKAKKAVIYVAIWVAILVLNYFIMSFFIKPEIAI
jgi:hypothetical protein